MRRARALALTTCTLLAPLSLRAQISLTHTEDAAPVPRGVLRVRLINGWTRYDERFAADGGRVSLGEELTTAALGPRQLPRLGAVEAGLRELAGDPAVRLSLGRLDVRSDARIVTTPVVLEYGVTRRFSVGLMIPVVQTRRAIQLRVNADSVTGANVGFVPARLRANAAQTNRAVADALQRGADALAALLARCTATSGAPECAGVAGNRADAEATVLSARRYAGAVRSSLGTDTATAFIAPRTASALAAAIDAQRLALNARLQRYLGGGFGASTPVFTAASDLSYIDLNGRFPSPGLLQSPVGGGLDSLRTTNRVSIGDVAVGARVLLLDRLAADSGWAGWGGRLVLGAQLRLATGGADSARNLVDISPGEGPGVEVNGAMDVLRGRVGGTVAARYVKAFARPVIASVSGPGAVFPFPLFAAVSRTAGDVVGVDVTPRFLLGEWFALDAHYGLERVGTTADVLPADAAAEASRSGIVSQPNAGGTSHRVGLGVRYSTVEAFARGRARYPVEVSFTHLETISGDVGVAKLFRDQIQLRLYLRTPFAPADPAAGARASPRR